ncbi:MAG: hypothetical protein ACAI25_19050 [Planctomycetota bacterium]
MSSKGSLRAALAVAVIAAAIGGLLVVGGGALRDSGTDRRRSTESARTPRPAREGENPGAPAGNATSSKDASRDAKKSSAPAPRDPVAPGSDARNAPGSPVASEPSAKEPTRDEILAGLARGEPGYELLASRLPVEKTKVTPVWREGDEWLVDTWYRQMQAPNEPWTGPTTWRFRVAGETSYRDQPCLEITVTRTDDPAFPPSVFYVTRDHRLAGVHTTVVQQGKQNRVEWAPEAGGAKALKAPFTVVPFDLPAVGAEARILPPGLSHEPPLAGDTTGANLPAADTLVGHGGASLELEFESPTDGSTIHQRWSSSDMRWPVYSRTQTTLSYRRER